MRGLLLIWITAILLCSCHRNPVWQSLDVAEELMEEHPDSALTILSGVDGKRLTGETQARHALLLSQAYDKNYIDLTNDSLISIAVDFYSRSDDRRHKMIAYHYLGTVYRNAERYGIALKSALKAHDEAVVLDDKPNISRTSSLIGRIYVMANNYKEALRWDLQALHYAKLVNNPVWIQNGYENVAEELTAMLRGHEALQYADSAIAISGTPSPDVLQTQYLTYNALKMTHERDSILSVIHALGYTPTHYITDILDHFKHRDTQELIAYQNKVIEDQNRYILEMTNSTMAEFVSMYNQEKSDQLNADIKSSKAVNIIISIIALFVIGTLCLMLWGLRLKASKQRIQNENTIQILSCDYERLKKELEANASVIHKLQQGVEDLSQQAENAAKNVEVFKHQAAVAFLQRFSWVNKLGNLYLDAELSSNNSVQHLYKNVTDELRASKRNSFVSAIEKKCKEENRDLWDEINALNLIDSEKEMLLLFLSGVSTRVICFISGKSPASVYNLKKRIKAKLHENATPFAQYIMSII